MRRINSLTAFVIMVFFAVHLIAGGFQLMGVLSGGNLFMKIISWIMLSLIGCHILISMKLTAGTLLAQRRAGTAYFKENKLFWLRRISGLAVMLFIVSHLMIFTPSDNGKVRLSLFEGAQLVSQILLVISLALHIISNIRPLMIAFGIRSGKELAVDVLTVTAVLLFFAGAAFAVYYIRWNTV